MSKNVTIASFFEAQEAAERFNWAISIAEPVTNPEHITCPNTLKIVYWDTIHDNGPSEANFIEVLEFVQEFIKSSEQNILVHCRAGVSRSTAVGILILLEEAGFKPGILEKLGEEKVRQKARAAVKKIYLTRSIASPNTLFIKHMEKYYGTRNIIRQEMNTVNIELRGYGIGL